MKCFLLILLTSSAVLAEENYNGLEWSPIDMSKVTPIEETTGFWKGTVFEKVTLKFDPKIRRIVGGQEVVPNSHPYQVYLLLEMLILTSACGGTVISPTVILTAAHCLTNVRRVTVVAGGHNIQIPESTQQRRSVESSGFRIHPEYSRPNVLNDIGTIILSSPLIYNQYVQPSNLADPDAGNFVGFESQSLGWGRTADGAPASNVLRGVFNTIIANSICEQFYGNVAINQDTVCIDTTGGRGVCNGDSGGPLIVVYNNIRTQVGIASFVHSSGCEVRKKSKNIKNSYSFIAIF